MTLQEIINTLHKALIYSNSIDDKHSMERDNIMICIEKHISDSITELEKLKKEMSSS